jgi:two-component system sensor histidine kinase/response regulator
MSTETRLPVPSSPDFGSARILVVDDQPANIQIVGSVLGKLGHEIIPAADGPTALKRVALRTPDLILLDLLMPGMGGCDVCLQLKGNAAWKDIPVIFLSASDDKDLIVRALDSGGVDYITKPFNQAELISRVRTQLALKAARDRLTQLAEDKDELMGILTHDLKSCLGGMNMTAGLLCERIGRLNDDRLQQLSENIFRSSAQALSFVREFLANAATDHGFALKITTVDLAEVVATTVEQYQDPTRRKQINLQIDAPDQPVMALVDATAVAQILDNLVSNALKFSPPGKSVFVSVAVVGGFAQCIVRDEGPGFTPEDKARMFRRYVRLSARPTGGEPSTGLGLSIVHKLVQAMLGELVCESSPGAGTTFTVRLPQPAQPL